MAKLKRLSALVIISSVSSLALLASCDRALRAPTQAEEIEEFCNQLASDFVADPSLGREQVVLNSAR